MENGRMDFTRRRKNQQAVRKGRCFLCRKTTQVTPLFTSAASVLNHSNASWAKSCLNSVCRLISIPEKHPCKQFMMAGNYCSDCIQLIRDIDFTLKSLRNFQHQLIGFREDFFTKLGDNYNAIPNRNLIGTSHEDIESSKISEKVTFGFDEVIKITFNRIEKESCRWTRTDFMKGDLSKNSVNIRSTPCTCSQNVWKGSKVEVNSITCHTTDESNESVLSKISSQHNTTIGVFDGKGENDGNHSTKTVEDPLRLCGVFNEDKSSDPNWAASDDVTDEAFDDLENDSKTTFNESENTEKTPQIVTNSVKAHTTTDGEFNCPEENCDTSLVSSDALTIHVRKVHLGDPKPYHCNRCELKFQYNASLVAHKKSHQIKYAKSQKCSLCSLKYSSKSLLKNHMKKVHNVCNPECKYCGAEFEKKEEYDEHENLHRNSDTPFKCLTCELVFTNSTHLKSHMKIHDSTSIICDVCGLIFRAECNLIWHKRRIHDPSFVEFKCKVCGLRCQSKSNLESHMLSHSDERKIVCDVCGDSFKLPNSFKCHYRRHLGILPFKCKICDKGFASSGALNMHEEIHSGISAYECSACGKKFRTRNNVKQHKVYHCPNIETSKVKSRKKRKRKDDTDEDSDTLQTNTTGQLGQHQNQDELYRAVSSI